MGLGWIFHLETNRIHPLACLVSWHMSEFSCGKIGRDFILDFPRPDCLCFSSFSKNQDLDKDTEERDHAGSTPRREMLRFVFLICWHVYQVCARGVVSGRQRSSRGGRLVLNFCSLKVKGCSSHLYPLGLCWLHGTENQLQSMYWGQGEGCQPVPPLTEVRRAADSLQQSYPLKAPA